MIGRPATDSAYFPFYAVCVDLGIPLSIHTSANWTRTRPSDLGHPRHIDQIACEFPDLKILMSHAGYPWVLEACLTAWKHPNVYLELGAHRPKYFATPGAGWEPLLRFGQTTIRDKGRDACAAHRARGNGKLAVAQRVPAVESLRSIRRR